ncbi:MAG TPA: esterase [Leptospiraceae bacterium]|nr:esterase [Leptospirales bacterium]HMU83493.1 esterase [Leptospiraceae bacterium]HMW59102.1 esterase [Leptospiraceae bacterium]HMX55183.1 esterase [Leptospiraceae bacterium]HMY45044.1 esterase [Leptospiraceae bacterium]
MKVQKKRIAELESFVVEGKDKGPVVVLCHGFGANAQDLLPLAEALSAPAGTTWIFPDAPIEFPIGPGRMGRAWFPLVAEEIARLAATGKHLNFYEVVPPGLEASRKKLEALIHETGRPANLITLGGFSQGSMLAVDTYLHASETMAGLVIMSGNLICRDQWTRLAPARRGSQFIQSHGLMDPVLPYENAKRLETVLREGGLSGEFISFSGGHEIPQGVIKKVSLYLTR